MPFVQRVIEPKYLSRISLHDENNKPVVSDCELEAVTNNTLSNALRQLASLVVVANDIFLDLTKQLENVQERSRTLKSRIETVDGKISQFDPKKVTVPESDISTFALLRNHFVRKQDLSTGLFNSDTRPRCIRALYAAATKTPVHVIRQMDRWRRDGHRNSRYFLCTPVLGAKRRKLREKIEMEIETRKPAVLDELRRWTSDEALGDVTVPPDCINRINVNISKLQSTSVINSDQIDASVTSGDEAIDHKLPSPEEQIIAIANKFPAEIVAVDISLKRFNRMCAQRRSLLHVDVTSRGDRLKEGDGGSENTNDGEDSTLRRRSRTRKPRGKRRNTIAGTDQKEIEEAVLSREPPSTNAEPEPSESTKSAKFVIRSKSSDLLRSSKRELPIGLGGSTSNTTTTKKSHFNSLKQWGINRLKMINLSFESKSNDTFKTEDIDDVNIYETITTKRRSNIDKIIKPTSTSTSSSNVASTKPPCVSTETSSNIPISTPITGAMNMAVKLRESAAQRRQKRNGVNKDEPHSSSGNWSASSESGRTSIGSEITTSTTTQPKSTTSCGTSSNSLNTHSLVPSSVASRRKFINTSNSSSITSEGTLTPDIIHDLHDDDGESSVYSCDTEGYYTSFHLDSGLKTLKEEDISLPSTPLQITTAFHDSPNRHMSAESEYELFGKGSTSTTTSSAGTICTTLKASGSQRSLLNGPAVPERKSSLYKLESSQDSKLQTNNTSLDKNYNNVESTGTIKRNTSGNKATVIAMVHKQSKGDESPDSGHNTSSSPIESINSPNGQRSCSEFEFSESSDLEGVDRIERIRLKTTINSSRIPSMCVITPPHSDDESVKSIKRYEIPKRKMSQKTPSEHSTESEQDEKQHSTKNVSEKPLRTEAPLETDIDADLPMYNQSSRIVVPIEGTKKVQVININPVSGYATVQTYDSKTPVKEDGDTRDNEEKKMDFVPKETKTNQPLLKSTLQPLNNMLDKLRTNISNLTHRSSKTPPKEFAPIESDVCDSGEYVTIADVRNNNKNISSSTTYYANDVIRRNLDNVLSGQIKDTEYVSLNELPSKIGGPETSNEDSLERKKRQGARVTLDAEGKVVYSSDSLRRRKGAHTTFEPGPYVKDISSITPVASPLLSHRTPKVIRSIGGIQDANRPLSPQLGKVVIRATSKSASGGSTPPPTADFVRMPPTTIVTPNYTTPLSPKITPTRGAYVNMQDSSLVSNHSEGPALFKYNNLQQISTIDVLKSPYIDHQLYDRHEPMQSQSPDHSSGFETYDRKSTVYRTLPSRKPLQSNVFLNDMQRSVTPDITRGLYQSTPRISSKEDSVIQQISPQHVQKQSKPVQTAANFASSTPTKETSATTSKIPMGISNFFSPIHGEGKSKMSSVPFNSSKISSIDSKNTDEEFKSSIQPLKSSEIKFPSAEASSSKLVPPKKSTMSYDELYAVIYKNKKKFNIKTTPDDDTVVENTSRDRHSWSPSNKETGQITKNLNKEPTGFRQNWLHSTTADRRIPVAKTSTMDFKKLLLSKSSPLSSPNTKMSAVEQLKLSKPQVSTNQQTTNMTPINILDFSNSPRSLTNRKLYTSPGGSPIRHGTDNKQKVVPKLMLSPRSAWRFANPRSDVLSSTILEDCREDESPNNSLEKNKNSNQQLAKSLNSDVSNEISAIESDKKTLVTLSNENITLRQQISHDENDKKSENNPSTIQTTSPTSGLTGMSRAQYLQVQKMQFFLSSGNNSASNNVQTQKQQPENTSSSNNSTKCPSPPTLETAL